MAFWKQSDDPWDRKPSKRPKQSAEPMEPRENPVDTLKSWNEQRKAAAKEKEEARRLPPEKCPWCGKDMEQGYLQGGRDAVHWHRGIVKSSRFARANTECFQVDDEYIPFMRYKTTWFCSDCKKIVFNAPEPEEEYVPLRVKLLSQSDQPDETKEEEKSEE